MECDICKYTSGNFTYFRGKLICIECYNRIKKGTPRYGREPLVVGDFNQKVNHDGNYQDLEG